MVLPAWIADDGAGAYEPPRDRDEFLRRNVLALAGMLAALRERPAPRPASAWDRALAHVAPAFRLLGTLVLVALVSIARNLAFCWVVLACFLAVLALRPPRQIAAVARPALALAAIAALVNLPAALLGGQLSSPGRLALKGLLTVGLMTSLSQALGVGGLLRALHNLRLPQQAVLTVEVAMRDLALLGTAAQSLSEALELRSVGHAADKTAGTAGVLGATFLRGHRLAAGQAEAMLLRGYGTGAPQTRARWRTTRADLLFCAGVACAVALFAYLEGAMR